MNTQYQFNIDRIEAAIDSVLLKASEDAAYVEKAFAKFKKLADAYPEGVEEGVFNAWLVHGNGDMRLLNSAIEDPELLETFKQAYFGLFKVWRNKQFLVFEDVFTKRQFPLPDQYYPGQFSMEALHLLHVYTLRGEHYVCGDTWSIASDHQTTVVQQVLKQYQGAKHLGAYTVEGFLKDTPLLLFWIVQTMKSISEEVIEDNYSVYELTCAVAQGAQAALLNQANVAESILEGVFTLQLEAANPIDFVFEGQRLVFDCPTEADAQVLKEWLETTGEALGIIFLDAKEVALEELLEADPHEGDSQEAASKEVPTAPQEASDAID